MVAGRGSRSSKLRAEVFAWSISIFLLLMKQFRRWFSHRNALKHILQPSPDRPWSLKREKPWAETRRLSLSLILVTWSRLHSFHPIYPAAECHDTPVPSSAIKSENTGVDLLGTGSTGQHRAILLAFHFCHFATSRTFQNLISGVDSPESDLKHGDNNLCPRGSYKSNWNESKPLSTSQFHYKQ